MSEEQKKSVNIATVIINAAILVLQYILAHLS